MGKWQLQDAKSRFSELIDRALDEGPQVITRRGEETAVVMSAEEYKSLRLRRQPLGEFLRESPLAGSKIELGRIKDRPRGDLAL
jgi:antitoxin Phd